MDACGRDGLFVALGAGDSVAFVCFNFEGRHMNAPSLPPPLPQDDDEFVRRLNERKYDVSSLLLYVVWVCML